MNINSILTRAEALLRGKGFSTPRLDAEVLLAACLKCDRLSLYTRRIDSITDERAEEFDGWITRRSKGEPVAYIVGEKEFWSLDFYVNKNALIPRPDTEVLVEEVIRISEEYAEKDNIKVLDVGTGSGSIGVAIASEYPNMTVVAIDSSLEAVSLARRNALRHNLLDRIFFVCASLLKPILGKFDIVVSNPPYISESEYDTLPPEVRNFEPRGALVAGPDGTEFHRDLVTGAQEILNRGGWLVMEVGTGQSKTIENMLREEGAYNQISSRRDYAGIERVVTGRRR
ncbi:MAG: peptide chain release factor N(5)-glutamine methyltransferase [Deltaproteobacteria bacterium]|nr:peptide chain release factor N(5)-glutamine methyltransferase [Deltaproteobacteria bacterium]